MPQQANKLYEILTLPIDYNKSFLDLNKNEIQKYYEWFLDIKTIRLNYLCKYLFFDIDKCLNESNLNVIDIFIQSSITTIPKPSSLFQAEFEKIPSQLKSIAKPDNYLLDDKTISICYDVGIYLGELMIDIDPLIMWTLETDDKYSDYGQPVLEKRNSKLKINPFRVVKNAAAKIHEGTYTDMLIISFFNAWKKSFNVNK